jgi:hypothetical protein
MRFGYFRVVFRVSKTISSSGVTAMPTSADCGVFASVVVDNTPSICFEMKL